MNRILETTAVGPKLGAPDAQTRLREAGADFEGFLIGSILRSATRPVAGEALLDGGPAGRMYRELFYEEMSRIAAHQRGLGLAELVTGQEPERATTGGTTR